MRGDVLATLGPRSRVAVALNVLAHISKRAADALRPAILQPGEGQYRTLALVDPCNRPIVQLNLLGESALAGDEVVTGFWPRAAMNPRKAALELLAEAEVESVDQPALQQILRATSLTTLASVWTLGISKDRRLEWGWSDGNYFSGPNPLIEAFEAFPAQWRQDFEDASGWGWQSSVFMVFEGSSTPVFAINIDRCEAVKPDGSSFDRLPVTLRDSDDLPVCSIGADLIDTATGKVLQTGVHASMVRYSAKLWMEENYSQVSAIPLFELSTEQDAVIFWNVAEGHGKDVLKGYLE